MHQKNFYLPIIIFAIISILLSSTQSSDKNFYDQQKQYSRVRQSIEQKEQWIKNLFDSKGLNLSNSEIFIRVLKANRLVELWAKNKASETYQQIKSYQICSLPGKEGPKRRQGDLQIPEGFYHIDRFNPVSNFYLSLGINYPNESDRVLGARGNLGGDIFIHGNCVTIGCVPITDDKIKELYLICVIARSNGQKEIPVHIFPTKLSGLDYEALKVNNRGNRKLLDFWENLQVGYQYFEANNKLPEVVVNQATGSYIFNGQ